MSGSGVGGQTTNSCWLKHVHPGKVHVEVRKGRCKSLQYGVKRKLCPVGVGDELASVRSCRDPQEVGTRMGKASRNDEFGRLGAEGSNQG